MDHEFDYQGTKVLLAWTGAGEDAKIYKVTDGKLNRMTMSFSADPLLSEVMRLVNEQERHRPLLERCLQRLTGEDEGEKCSAMLWHGPGHQSRTPCSIRGPHEAHYAVYGSYENAAYWLGEKRHTGAFDEPPSLSEELETKWAEEQDARHEAGQVLLDDLRRELGKRQ